MLKWDITPELRFKTSAGVTDERSSWKILYKLLNPEHGEAILEQTLLTEQQFQTRLSGL